MQACDATLDKQDAVRDDQKTENVELVLVTAELTEVGRVRLFSEGP